MEVGLMHFDITNFLSGMIGALCGGIVRWLLSMFIRPSSPEDSMRGIERGSPKSPSIILAAASIVGVLIGIYLLTSGSSK